MSLKNALYTPQYPSWVFILRALVLWCASQLFLFEVKKNLDSLAFIIIGKKYGRLCVCVCVCVYFCSWKTEHVLLLLELSQSHKMGYCAYLIS